MDFSVAQQLDMNCGLHKHLQMLVHLLPRCQICPDSLASPHQVSHTAALVVSYLCAKTTEQLLKTVLCAYRPL